MKRTKEERINEARKIVDKLNELKLTIVYEPVAKLFEQMRIYIQEDKMQEKNIPFYVINRNITGFLETDVSKPCVVKLIEMVE